MDDSRLESIRVLYAQTKHHYKVLIAGAVVSLLGWIALTVGLQRLPLTWLLSGLGCTLLVAMFLAFHDVRVKRDQFGKQLEPQLEMFDNDPACYQEGDNDGQGHFQTRKVIVRNIGGTSITGLRVSLVNIRPDDERLTQIMPLPLQPQHVPVAAANYGLALAPGESIPIGVFGVNTKTADFLLYHVVAGARNLIRGLEDDSYLVDIQAIGNNIQPVTRVARIGRGVDARPTLVLLP